jgi:release factor glutamine methyltransferase
MLIRELLNSSSVRGVEAEIILTKILGRPRTYILAHPDQKISPQKVATFNKYARRRLKGEPLAYIFGTVEFCGFELAVNKDVLIPRPETEWLVNEAIRIIQNNPAIKNIIDIGTGSGAIILSVYRMLPRATRSSKQWLATDISKKSLRVAKYNARRFKNSTIKFKQADLLKTKLQLKIGEVLILANLPYLTADDYRATPLEVKKYEPKTALVAGHDGLKFYRPLLKQMANMRAKTHYLFEIDPCQAAAIKKLAKSLGPAKLVKDFNSQPRYLLGLTNPPKITTT